MNESHIELDNLEETAFAVMKEAILVDDYEFAALVFLTINDKRAHIGKDQISMADACDYLKTRLDSPEEGSEYAKNLFKQGTTRKTETK